MVLQLLPPNFFLPNLRYFLKGESWFKSYKIEEQIVTKMQNSNASLVVKSNQIQQIGGQERYHCTKLGTSWWGTAIAPWIRLCLPSCRPEFVSQACHLCFYNLQSNCYICHENKQKEAGFGPFKIKIGTSFTSNDAYTNPNYLIDNYKGYCKLQASCLVHWMCPDFVLRRNDQERVQKSIYKKWAKVMQSDCSKVRKRSNREI